MISLVFDCETNGLFKRGSHYTDLKEFDKARLVSISWLIIQGSQVVEQSYYIVKPISWEISEESMKIHKISNDYAHEHGIPIEDVLTFFIKSMKKAQNIVAHNMKFDENIIQSELYRQGYVEDLDIFKKKHKICTMMKGKQFMMIRKYPKLAELYKHLYNDEITNAHNALYDTEYCYKCYIKLFPCDPNVFYFADTEVKLTEEQQRVVFEDINKNILVAACPGSGKSTSILTRVKYLIDKGIPEDSIIMTTFTRNAAKNMKDKLLDIMGYKSKIQVGTIDSIACYYVEQYLNNDNKPIEKIEDYSKIFLESLKGNEKPIFLRKIKYLIVDEFQDINRDQFNLIYEFYRLGTILMSVGDIDQNIYEFRGSDKSFMLNFMDVFNNSVVHKLSNNFRSSQSIIDMANMSIQNNLRRYKNVMIAASKNLLNKKPMVYQTTSENDEYNWVIINIKRLLEEGYKHHNICIMSPLNKPLQNMHNMLNNNMIPSYLNTSYDDSDTDTLAREGLIKMNTIHRSKGLEWDVVFLINMTDDQNKNVYSYNKKCRSCLIGKKKCEMCVTADIEANRRLFYVAITRAKQQLYISTPREITRFITEIEPHLYDLTS